jgi:hypothetical protein
MALSEGTWVRLSGDDYDVGQVAETFADPPAIVFERDEHGKWWMKLKAFVGIEDPHEIESVATDVIRAINGCAQVLWGNHRPVGADSAIGFVDAEGRLAAHVLLVGSIEGRSRLGIPTLIVSGQAPPAEPPQHTGWLRLALRDPSIASAMRIVS